MHVDKESSTPVDAPPSGDSGATSPARARPLTDTVLGLIWEARRISRADLARETRLARSTISEIVSTLIPTGLVYEVGLGRSRGGRRPIVLEFRDDACCILGVEMGAAHVAVALTDLRGRVLAWRQRAHEVREDPDGTRAVMVALCNECLAARPADAPPLLGIGVAVPSPHDPADPDHLSETVLPAWHGRSGVREVLGRFEVPILIDNDANLGALAEQWWGAGKGLRDFAYVKVATGVGSGHVVAGEIYRGATGVAGEIGHMAIDPNGGPCLCGLRGCLATFVGADALVARARALAGEYPDSTVAAGTQTVAQIENAALQGDELATQVVNEAAEHLGVALAGMLNLMNPARVIIGGGFSRLGERLLAPLRETLRHRTLLSSIDATDICTSELGPRTIAIGASTLVLKAALGDSRLFPADAARPRPQ